MAEAVLIVEDDWDLRAMMEQTLHLEGFAPFVASNGKVALEILRSGAPIKIILLDLMMPIMDGWTFRREQLSDPRISEIPVVVLSAVSERAQQIRPLASFPKPVAIGPLIDFLRQWQSADRR